MSVYFIRNGNYIKIGKSVDPWKRMTSLQTAHHDTLEMLAIMPGSDELEAGLHRSFSQHIKRGEWFEQNDQLLAFIEVVKATFPDMQRRFEYEEEKPQSSDASLDEYTRQLREIHAAKNPSDEPRILPIGQSIAFRMTHKGLFRYPRSARDLWSVIADLFRGGYWHTWENDDWRVMNAAGLRYEFADMQHIRVTCVGEIQERKSRYVTPKQGLEGALNDALKNAIYNRKNTGPWLGVYNDEEMGIVIALRKEPLQDSYVKLDVPEEVIDYWRQYQYKSPLPEGVTIEA